MSVPEYTIIATDAARDTRLSYAARGLLVYLASLKPGDPSPSGDISPLLCELEDRGYVTVTDEHDIVITDFPGQS